jgi:MFS family permease
MSTSELGLRTWWIREPGKPAIYRIAIGGLITALGSDATAVAFGFYLYDRTGSALWLSIWFFLSFGITGVLTPVFGWLADRFDRRRLILFSDVAAAACSTALIAAHDPVVLVAIAFVASIVGRAGSPSFAAALPNLAGEERLEWANGTLGVAFNIGRLVGPIVGGALYVAAGRSVVFGFDAVTYLVAGASIWSLLVPFRAADADDRTDAEEAAETKSGVLRGFSIVFADRRLRALIFIWAAGYFAVDIVLVGELPLARALGAGALAFGVLEAAWGGGSILGSLLGRKLREDQDVLGISIGVVGIVIGWGLIGLSPWFIPIIALSALAAVASGVEDVAAFSMIQRSASDDVRGRVFSAFQTSGLIANAIAFAIAGTIVDWLGPRSVFVLGAVVSALCVPLLRPLALQRATRTEVVPPPA